MKFVKQFGGEVFNVKATQDKFFKLCWTFQNVCELKSQWGREFETGPPTQVAIGRILNTLETQQPVLPRLLQCCNNSHDQQKVRKAIYS